MVRLQKFLADAGVASRRAERADHHRGSGHGERRGRRRNSARRWTRSTTGSQVDGKPVRVKRKIYLALHKPRGWSAPANDEHGRPTIFDLLPKEWGHLHSVGRLDYQQRRLDLS